MHANEPWLTSSVHRGLIRVMSRIFEWVMSRMKIHESWLQISHAWLSSSVQIGPARVMSRMQELLLWHMHMCHASPVMCIRDPHEACHTNMNEWRDASKWGLTYQSCALKVWLIPHPQSPVHVHVCVCACVCARVRVCVCARERVFETETERERGRERERERARERVRMKECIRTWHTHVTHISKWGHTYEWVRSHIWMGEVTHMNEWGHTYEWVRSHIWMSEVTHMNDATSGITHE